MKKKNVAALLAALMTATSFQAYGDIGFRSLVLSGSDGSSVMTVNLSDEQRLSFTSDSLCVNSPKYQFKFALKDISSWRYSSDWNPAMPGEGPVHYYPEGDGTWSAPFNTASCIEGATGSDVWVKGFIVGSFSGSSVMQNANFSTSGHVAANILLAPEADVNDPKFCVPVQLVFESPLRPALNLSSNPANRGQEVSVRGTISTYGGVVGVINPTHYNWGNVGFDVTGIDKTEMSETVFKLEGSTLLIDRASVGAVVTLTDLSGRVVVRAKVSDNGSVAIDLSLLKNSGTYIITVNGVSIRLFVSL